MDYINIIIPFAGGLGLFIYGMQIMAHGLENAAGSRMKRLLEVLTSNKIIGVLLGAIITAVIQSSSATTVMIVGFVNAGIVNLTQAMSVIMGANIGTTVTGWLVSSVEWAKFLSPTTLAPIAVIVGVVIMITAKKGSTKEVASIIIGFGILFIGISMMSDAVYPLRDSESFKSIFIVLGSNPLLGILAGAVVTAVIQSSSASVGILQTLAASGLVPFSAAVYIIMGQNIGTCVTAMLSSIGAKKNAKTAAYMHLLFNIVGSVIFSIVAIIIFKFVVPNMGAGLITQTQISGVHTIFNIGTTILLFPFSASIIKLAMKLNRTPDENTNEVEFLHLDDRILETPSIAVQSALKEVIRVGDITANCVLSMKHALLEDETDAIEQVLRQENQVDKLTDGITEYLVKIGNTHINTKENEIITALLQVIIDIERVSDYCENIAETVLFMRKEAVSFSNTAIKELKEMVECTEEGFVSSIRALENSDHALAEITVESEKKVDIFEMNLRTKHIVRLTNRECNTKAGVVFLDTLTHLERISDHSLNIAQVVLSDYKITI